MNIIRHFIMNILQLALMAAYRNSRDSICKISAIVILRFMKLLFCFAFNVPSHQSLGTCTFILKQGCQSLSRPWVVSRPQKSSWSGSRPGSRMASGGGGRDSGSSSSNSNTWDRNQSRRASSGWNGSRLVLAQPLLTPLSLTTLPYRTL